MDIATWGRIMFARGVLAAIEWGLANLAGLDLGLTIPLWMREFVLLAISAALNAIAAHIRANFPTQKLSLGQKPAWIWRVF